MQRGQKHYQGDMARDIALRIKKEKNLVNGVKHLKIYHTRVRNISLFMQGGHQDEFFSLRFHSHDTYEYEQTSGFL